MSEEIPAAMEERILTRDEILNAIDMSREFVKVPEWGGGVFVRGMSGAERVEFDQNVTTAKSRVRAGQAEANEFELAVDMHKMRIRVCAWCMVDRDGNRIFTDRDVVRLGQKSDKPLQRIYQVALRKSGLNEEAQQQAQDFSTPAPDDENSSE